MTLTLRIGLLIGALFIFALVCFQVRRRSIRVADSVFWVAFSLVLVLFAVVPQIPYGLSRLMGIESPSNFVFAVAIGILIVIDVRSSAKISQLTAKLETLASRVALEHDRYAPPNQAPSPSPESKSLSCGPNPAPSEPQRDLRPNLHQTQEERESVTR